MREGERKVESATAPAPTGGGEGGGGKGGRGGGGGGKRRKPWWMNKKKKKDRKELKDGEGVRGKGYKNPGACVLFTRPSSVTCRCPGRYVKDINVYGTCAFEKPQERSEQPRTKRKRKEKKKKKKKNPIEVAAAVTAVTAATAAVGFLHEAAAATPTPTLDRE
ncbi:hypothetical protein M0804_010914 [Polistes exclamans]|nr:hypothetical protein M0804_010914 [Polistes exclamans]